MLSIDRLSGRAHAFYVNILAVFDDVEEPRPISFILLLLKHISQQSVLNVSVERIVSTQSHICIEKRCSVFPVHVTLCRCMLVGHCPMAHVG